VTGRAVRCLRVVGWPVEGGPAGGRQQSEMVDSV